MNRAPRVTGAQLVSALAGSGFRVVRIRGSHHFLQHQDGRRTVVPVHASETIGPGLLLKIARDCKMTSRQMADLLRT
ncbi:MAG: type II toxin-antitoxin system HicA family toxin [Bryobacterales bacterium]|nr:type II toxin-antitoxin system HicA family toxin [Bryobacterales bacterium]